MEDTEFMEKFSKLTPEQRKVIESDIRLLLADDSEVRGELTELKHQAYKMYAVEIASLIAELEVHSHDLPKWVYGLLETIFRLYATAAGQDEHNALEMYKAAINYEVSLINILRLALIDYYVKEVKGYKRIMARFNHHAVRTQDNEAIIPAIRRCLKEISALKNTGCKAFRKQCKFHKRNGTLEFNTAEGQNINDLEKAVNFARNGMSLCEQFYPVVINNGFTSSWPARVIHHLPEVISFVIAVIGAVILILK